MNNIYFNFISIGGGLADTLYKIDALYSLGEFLGFKYAFSPLQAKRSSDSILDDLGINQALQNSTDVTTQIKKQCEISELLLPNELILNATSINEIRDFIFSNLRISNKQNSYLLFKSFFNKKIAMLHLRKLLRDAGLSSIFLREKIPLRENYKRLYFPNIIPQKKANFNKKIKILLHIRKGDTHCFQLNDNTLISAWGNFKIDNKGSNKPLIVNSLKESPYYQIDNQNYLDIVTGLINKFGADKLDITIASDGYTRGVNRILEFAEELKLNSEQIQEIHTLDKILEEKLINDFQPYANKLIIGETKDNLLKTIDDIIKSDVIISPIGGLATAINEYFSRLQDRKIVVGTHLLPFYLSKIQDCQHSFATWHRQQNYHLKILNWIIQEIEKTQQ